MSPAALQIMKAEVKRYIDEADEKTVKMVHAMLEVAEAEEVDADAYWAEMDRRVKEYEDGKTVTMTLEELNEEARQYTKAKMANKTAN